LFKLKEGARSELAFVGSLLLLGLIVIWDTSRTELPNLKIAVSPNLFPYLIGYFLVILCVILAIQIIRGGTAIPEGLEAGGKIEKSDYKTFGYVLLSFISYIVLITRGGFVVASTVVFLGIAFSFGNRKFVKTLLIGLIFAVVTYFTFTRYLHVDLPAGILKGIL